MGHGARSRSDRIRTHDTGSGGGRHEQRHPASDLTTTPHDGGGLRAFLHLGEPVSSTTTPPRMWLLSGAAVLLGLAAGGAAVLLFTMIGFLTHVTLLHDIGTSLPTLRGYHPSLWIIPTAVLGAFFVSLFALWSPVIRGHGIPESLEAIMTRDSRIRPRAAAAKPLSAAITIGTGGPFGAEGPIIVTGGSFGSLLGQLLSVTPAERKILLAIGAAAGMAATFNTPIAAVVLAVELVLFERTLRTIVPLAIACGIAASVHVFAFGTKPLFAIPGVLHVSLFHLPWFLLVGLAAGIMAVVLNRGLFLMEAGFRHLPVNIFWWPMIGALIYSVIGYFQPRTLSMGYSAIVDTIEGHFVLGAVALLFVAKLFSWWVALGSQTSGGTLAPMFLVGALLGSLLGHGVSALFPAAHVSIAAFALASMAAVFGASTKAVLASVVFAAEVTGQYEMVIPLLIATAVADLVAQVGLKDRIMTEKLSHRGFRVDFETVTDPLRMRLAHHIMTAPVTIPATHSVLQAQDLLAGHGLKALAVTGPHERYLGMVTAAHLSTASPDMPVHAVSLTSMHVAEPTDFLDGVLATMIDAGLDALPVVSDGMVVGLATREDILRYRHQSILRDQTRQPGWWAARKTHRPRLGRPRPGRGTPRGLEHATVTGPVTLPAVPPLRPSPARGLATSADGLRAAQGAKKTGPRTDALPRQGRTNPAGQSGGGNGAPSGRAGR